MNRPDLHLHSTASDGIYAPKDLICLLQKADITCFSITDHDTIAGIPEARQYATERGLAFLPGVEISAEGEMEVHILGYGIREESAALLSFFHRMEEYRQGRMLAMGEKLKKLGVFLPLDEITASAGTSIGRPHLARAMVARGYVSSVQEAFEKYLGRGCPAFVPREKVSATQAISMLRQEGAVPVLAHPALMRLPMEHMLPLLNAWQDAGLMGMEVYHPANRWEFTAFDRLARQRGLLVTGGSDFHDHNPGHGQIGETIASWPNAGEDAWKLFRACSH